MPLNQFLHSFDRTFYSPSTATTFSEKFLKLYLSFSQQYSYKQHIIIDIQSDRAEHCAFGDGDAFGDVDAFGDGNVVDGGGDNTFLMPS